VLIMILAFAHQSTEDVAPEGNTRGAKHKVAGSKPIIPSE
jgi:hypothetical protein